MTKLRALSAFPLAGVTTCLTASFVALGCMGTETGNPIGDSGPGDEQVIEGVPVGEQCELAVTELDWDEDWGPGFSAADVAAHFPDELTTTLRFHETTSLSYGPESGFGEIEVSIEPRERAYVVGPEPQAGNDGPVSEGPVGDYGSECARTLHVESKVTLKSSGGALDDTFLVTLATRVFADTTHTHFRVPVDALHGDLHAELDLPEGQSLASPLDLEVEMWLSPAGLTAALRIASDVVDENDAPVASSPIALGRFPADQPCGLGAHFLEGDQTLHSFSHAEVVERLMAASGEEWTYEHQDGTTELSWSLPDAPVSGCVGAEQTGVEFLTPLVIESADGSVDGTFMVNVYATGNADGTFSALQIAGGAYEQDIADAQDLGERYGITDPAPLDGYVGGMTDFLVDVTREPWGIFRYAGLTQDDCSDASQSCEGMLQTVLFGAHFGDPRNGYELVPVDE